MRVLDAIALAVVVGCGASQDPPKDAPKDPPKEAAKPPVIETQPLATTTMSTAAARTPPTLPTTADVFARTHVDLTACYETGRKSVPAMTSGRITFHAAIDADGRTACVVPSDDTGLTQDVENCMRTRLDKETYPKTAASWSLVLPITVKDGKLALGEQRQTAPSIETIESHGLAEDVYDVIETLLPDLYGCVTGIAKSSDMRVVYVGARVGAGGQVECALASGPSTIPADARACTAKVFGRAKFRAPKKGYGLVSVPLNVMSRK